METIQGALKIALQHHQDNCLKEAEAIYRQILQVQPDHPDALHLLGMIAHQVGQHPIAIEYISRAIALNPNAAEFHNDIGGAYRAQGRLEDAVTHYRQALRLKPDYAMAHSNLGAALQEQGQLSEAVEHYRQALRLRPDYAEAHSNLGAALQEQGQLSEAVEHCRQALRLRPDYAEAHSNLGAALQAQGQLSEAVEHYRQALRLKPDYAEVHSNLGAALREQGQLSEAVEHCRQALRLKPDFAKAHSNLGAALQEQGQLSEAVEHCRQALRLRPDYAEAHNILGVVLHEQGKLEEADACYRQAVALKPTFAVAYKNLGGSLKDQSNPEEAVAQYRQALALTPNDGLRILIATALPVIPESKDHLLETRRNYEQQVLHLLEQNLVLSDPSIEVGTTNFYLAYQGFNDRDLQRSVSRLYEKACPSLNYVAAHCQPYQPPPAGGTIKIGFLSKFLNDHTIGRLMRGIIAQLSRSRFSVSVFLYPHPPDQMSEFIVRHSDRTIVLPTTLGAARSVIAAERLDILFYPDIGMDPFGYFLAFSRLAPMQCVTWGHPDTTGLRAIDYFISSKYLEPDEADQHYGEKLVRLKHLPTYYYKPDVPPGCKSRKDFGLEEGRVIYLCPQSLYKFHPDFDELIAGVLRSHSDGQVVILEGQYKHFTELILRRFQNTIPDVVDRIHVLPRQSSRDFMCLLSVVDVILDPLTWSGGNTTFEALSFGTPIVTLPGEFMRGRVTYACYKQMGFMDCVATTKGEYVKLAVRLGTDPRYRAKIKAKILAANDVLYENVAAVRDMERFFVEAVAAAQRPAKKTVNETQRK